jgi:hypothetical protein
MGAVVSTGMPSAVVGAGKPSAVVSAHLGKEIAYAARADAHEHLDEVGAADGVKGALGLPGRRLGE